jgi:hypothetical protein
VRVLGKQSGHPVTTVPSQDECIAPCGQQSNGALEVKRAVCPDLGKPRRPSVPFFPDASTVPSSAIKLALSHPLCPLLKSRLMDGVLGHRRCAKVISRFTDCKYFRVSSSCIACACVCALILVRALTTGKAKCQPCISRCMGKQSPALEVKQCAPGFGKRARPYLLS